MEQKRFTPGPKITARWNGAKVNWQSTSCNGHQLRRLSSSDCGVCFLRSASLLKPSAAPALEFSRWDHFPQIPLARFIAAFFFSFLSVLTPPPPPSSFKRLNCYSTLHISPGLYSVSSRLFATSSLYLQLEKDSDQNMLNPFSAFTVTASRAQRLSDHNVPCTAPGEQQQSPGQHTAGEVEVGTEPISDPSSSQCPLLVAEIPVWKGRQGWKEFCKDDSSLDSPAWGSGLCSQFPFSSLDQALSWKLSLSWAESVLLPAGGEKLEGYGMGIRKGC